MINRICCLLIASALVAGCNNPEKSNAVVTVDCSGRWHVGTIEIGDRKDNFGSRDVSTGVFLPRPASKVEVNLVDFWSGKKHSLLEKVPDKKTNVDRSDLLIAVGPGNSIDIKWTDGYADIEKIREQMFVSKLRARRSIVLANPDIQDVSIFCYQEGFSQLLDLSFNKSGDKVYCGYIVPDKSDLKIGVRIRDSQEWFYGKGIISAEQLDNLFSEENKWLLVKVDPRQKRFGFEIRSRLAEDWQDLLARESEWNFRNDESMMFVELKECSVFESINGVEVPDLR